MVLHLCLFVSRLLEGDSHISIDKLADGEFMVLGRLCPIDAWDKLMGPREGFGDSIVSRVQLATFLTSGTPVSLWGVALLLGVLLVRRLLL